MLALMVSNTAFHKHKTIQPTRALPSRVSDVATTLTIQFECQGSIRGGDIVARVPARAVPWRQLGLRIFRHQTRGAQEVVVFPVRYF